MLKTLAAAMVVVALAGCASTTHVVHHYPTRSVTRHVVVHHVVVHHVSTRRGRR